MKRALVLLSLTLFALSVSAAQFVAGVHYQELPFPQPVEGDKIEVREFFWYGCPHCYVLEPAIAQWLKRKPANVEFVRTPGVAPRWLLHAQAYYAFEALGAVAKLHPALFTAMHKDKQRFDSAEALAVFVGKHGVDGAAFRDAFNSFSVRINVEKAKRLNQTYTIHSVPMFVVDGKYVTSPSLAGGDAATIKVLDELIARAARERGQRGR